MGWRLNHKKGSGAASLTLVVSWAEPEDFDLTVLKICVCMHAFVRAALDPVVFGVVQVCRETIPAWESLI